MGKTKPCIRCGKPTVHTCFSCSNALCSACSEIDLLCATCRSRMPYKRHESEVARLLEIIDLEYQSAELGLSGLAQGCSQHEFITARMENMDKSREELEKLVGHDEAMRLVVEQLDKSVQEKPKGSER